MADAADAPVSPLEAELRSLGGAHLTRAARLLTAAVATSWRDAAGASAETSCVRFIAAAAPACCVDAPGRPLVALVPHLPSAPPQEHLSAAALVAPGGRRLAAATDACQAAARERAHAHVDDALELASGAALLHLQQRQLRQPADSAAHRAVSQREAVERLAAAPLEHWLDGFDAALVLTGQRGTGKSALSFGCPALLEPGRPSFCGAILAAAFRRLRVLLRQHVLHHPLQPQLRTNALGRTDSASSSDKRGAEPPMLSVCMWGVRADDDVALDLLVLQAAPVSALSQLRPVAVIVASEEEARRVIAAGLVRSGCFEAAGARVAPAKGEPSSTLLPLPGRMHVFLRLDLSSRLLEEPGDAARVAVAAADAAAAVDDLVLREALSIGPVGSGAPYFRCALTLVDLCGTATISGVGAGTPVLRLREQDASRLQSPSPVLPDGALLALQHLSVARMLGDVAQAQQASSLHQRRTAVSERDLERTLSRLLEAVGGASPATQARAQRLGLAVHAAGLGATAAGSKLAAFGGDRNSNAANEFGLRVSLQSPRDRTGSSWLRASYVRGAAEGLSQTPRLRDSLLARCLAPLLSGGVLASIIGLVSSAEADATNSAATLRLLAAAGRIEVHAVRGDVMTPYSALPAVSSMSDSVSWWNTQGLGVVSPRRDAFPVGGAGHLVLPPPLNRSRGSDSAPHAESPRLVLQALPPTLVSPTRPPPQPFPPPTVPDASKPALRTTTAPATAFATAYQAELQHHRLRVGEVEAASSFVTADMAAAEREERLRTSEQRATRLDAIEAVAAPSSSSTRPAIRPLVAAAELRAVLCGIVAPAPESTAGTDEIGGAPNLPELRSGLVVADMTRAAPQDSATQTSAPVPAPVAPLGRATFSWLPFPGAASPIRAPPQPAVARIGEEAGAGVTGDASSLSAEMLGPSLSTLVPASLSQSMPGSAEGTPVAGGRRRGPPRRAQSLSVPSPGSTGSAGMSLSERISRASNRRAAAALAVYSETDDSDAPPLPPTPMSLRRGSANRRNGSSGRKSTTRVMGDGAPPRGNTPLDRFSDAMVGMMGPEYMEAQLKKLHARAADESGTSDDASPPSLHQPETAATPSRDSKAAQHELERDASFVSSPGASLRVLAMTLDAATSTVNAFDACTNTDLAHDSAEQPLLERESSLVARERYLREQEQQLEGELGALSAQDSALRLRHVSTAGLSRSSASVSLLHFRQPPTGLDVAARANSAPSPRSLLDTAARARAFAQFLRRDN